MLWTCTTVQQGCGRRLSSARRAVILQLHLLGTWLCSLVVTLEVRFCAGRGGRSVDGCVRVECFARSAELLFSLPLPLSCAPLQMLTLMLRTCTTVQQSRGRRLSSAWRAGFLHLHLLGTLLCSLEVP